MEMHSTLSGGARQIAAASRHGQRTRAGGDEFSRARDYILTRELSDVVFPATPCDTELRPTNI